MQEQVNELVKISRVTAANTISKSLRATIPSNVVDYLGLQSGDVIEWENFVYNGKKSARIRKLS